MAACFEKDRHNACKHERILREKEPVSDMEAYYYCPKCNARFAAFIATELTLIETFLNGNSLWKRVAP